MICVLDIAYARFQVADLDKQAEFLQDFGLRMYKKTDNALYMASAKGGYPSHISIRGPNCPLGLGFIAKSIEDLQCLAVQFGTTVQNNVELGAGQIVSITDPDGYQVDVLFGGEVVPPLETRAPLSLNNSKEVRRTGSTNRVLSGASHAVRLGHVVLKTINFKAMLAFYQDVLGFKVSDSYHVDVPENLVGVFMHCGLGSSYTDHHTIALLNLGNTERQIDHCAFEVLDLDDLAMGNQYLAQRGYTHSWGIGRHVQGSQIFDYWRDPFGNKIEHWTDGDLVNDQTPVSNEPLSPDALAQWSPPLSADFMN
ncbi:VOC family protein [Pseudomonas fluorescens]|nr:VOC family protein [Pseudomonas fluorescens]